jgi:CRP-like cAMP-binding protein
MVKVYDIGPNGDERTLNIVSQGHIFPIIGLLAKPPTNHLYYYEAFTELYCYIVPAKRFIDYMHAHPELAARLLDLVIKSYVNFIGRVQNLEKSQIHERLEFILYWLANGLGAERRGSVVRIDAKITQQDMAGLTGVTRESMSHALNQPNVKQIFWRNGSRTYINLEFINTDILPRVFNIHDDRLV